MVNLSDVETFFNEKRPFFVEGSSTFDFGSGGQRNFWGFNWSGPQFFYSRRIGRSLGTPPPPVNGYVDGPSGAHILGALKLTGKVAGSWNVGGLTAVTAREHAHAAGSDEYALDPGDRAARAPTASIAPRRNSTRAGRAWDSSATIVAPLV